MPRAAASALVVLLGAGALAGCAATVSMTPAVDANDPACAEVVTRLPVAVSGLERRYTDAQATGAWGDPAGVLLTCGVADPGPTTLPCVTVNGVDWVADDSEAPRFRFTTFGRDPAVEVYLDYSRVSGRETLEDLSIAVGTLPATGAVCTERPADDETPTASPTS